MSICDTHVRKSRKVIDLLATLLGTPVQLLVNTNR